MKSDTEKQIGCDPAPPRQVHTMPLPKDTERCEGCPYPHVGFICWSVDGTCLRTDMDRISKPGRC
jgi:hypothetical protein